MRSSTWHGVQTGQTMMVTATIVWWRSQKWRLVEILITACKWRRIWLPFCPLCVIDKEVRKMTVKGLCTETGYNKDYLFTITDEGSLLYMGDHTSYIYFDKETLVWRWYDRKNNHSVATCLSTENSMLLGVHCSCIWLFYSEWRHLYCKTWVKAGEDKASCGEGNSLAMMANVWIWRRDITKSQTARMSLMKIIAKCRW